MNKINIEDVLKRANAIVLSDFNEEDIFTTWIISRSNKPITREEATEISICFNTCPVIFIPEPKNPDVKFTIYDLREMDAVKTRDGKVWWVLKGKDDKLGIVDDNNMGYILYTSFYKDFKYRSLNVADINKDIIEISFLSSNPSRAVQLMAELRKINEKDVKDKEKYDVIQREFNWIKVFD